jgi:uncharacterized protein (TIGR00255 family)
MTGCGRGVAETDGRRVTVEVRSVNHRYLEIKLRPGAAPGVEERIGREIRRHVERGALSVSLAGDRAGAAEVRVDLDLARRTAAALGEVRAALGLAEPVGLALVVAQPGVLRVGEQETDADAAYTALAPALTAALAELTAMRRREGATLATDLRARLGRLLATADRVGVLSAAAPDDARRRLRERVDRLLAGTAAPVDPGRLEAEIALLADRQDITEELVRLRSHVAQAEALIAEDAPVGRRLDFLVQELGREVNTIGSKSQTAEIGHLVVDAKAELEKIREQVQNVE